MEACAIGDQYIIFAVSIIKSYALLDQTLKKLKPFLLCRANWPNYDLQTTCGMMVDFCVARKLPYCCIDLFYKKKKKLKYYEYESEMWTLL